MHTAATGCAQPFAALTRLVATLQLPCPVAPASDDTMQHSFTPTVYHDTLGSHLPVYTVGSGDTIVTTTIDAAGMDAHGEQVGPPGNPQTGPFYVEDAQPGDTLAVRFDRIWPNRDHGFCSRRLRPNVLDPGYLNDLPTEERVQFRIDQDGATATLEDGPPGVEDLTVPLRPMLGCFGVAPSRGQAISAVTSGPHGGNMDYNGFVAGTTAYLPVFVEGALLHVGDGHAWQGDGELLGTGIEISMDVVLTVWVIKDETINWPRGENDTYVFAVGNARPLDQALQHATTEMVRWLQGGFGLDATSANILLGMYAEYDVGNVIDPAFTMVCKLPKRALPPRTT